MWKLGKLDSRNKRRFNRHGSHSYGRGVYTYLDPGKGSSSHVPPQKIITTRFPESSAASFSAKLNFASHCAGRKTAFGSVKRQSMWHNRAAPVPPPSLLHASSMPPSCLFHAFSLFDPT